MQVLNGNSTDAQVKTDQKLFMDQRVKLRLDQKDTRSIKIGIGV
jgi:hypothetical protein